MHLSELYQNTRPDFSIEIFPPKEPELDGALFRALDKLAKFKPAFVSCTYGAGGSTRERTLDLCKTLQERYGVSATAHFTCIGASKNELIEWLVTAKKANIPNILALRGDPQVGQAEFKAVEGGLSHANELVSLIKANFPHFGIGVAGYPEGHVEAKDKNVDLNYLKAKVDAGADVVFTQLFFDNRRFFDFYERYEKMGIKAPLIPGIMPITDFSRIQKITSMCGSHFPVALASRLEKVKNNPEEQLKIGIEHAATQCLELLDQGVRGLHFYALNLSRATKGVLELIGFDEEK